MAKLSHLVNGEWAAYVRPPVFAMEALEPAGSRIVAAAPEGFPSLLETLAGDMTAPLFMLYVLHTPRGEGEAGRYQSPPLAVGDVTAFLKRFGSFLADDSRCDLWIHSPADAATLVWDRHDLLHIYGDTDKAADTLRARGFAAGTPAIPSPHMHRYEATYDADAAALLDAFAWRRTPLRPEDEQ
ncbi:hypothetical protein [Ancylobacter terrae]|uniref:hypothetical protein n=1 Tax=Ancylobacter sp. sgz301288 TaxID=3342077 RepID=UPI003858856B